MITMQTLQANQKYIAQNGAVYTSDARRFIYNVSLPDILSLSGAGCVVYYPQGSISALSFLDYPGAAAVSQGADATTVMKAFEQWAVVQALSFNSSSLDDQLERSYLDTDYPRGRYSFSSAITKGQYTRLTGGMKMVRNGAAGTFLSNPAGVYYPALLLPPRSHIERLQLYCNPDGNPAHSGAGLMVGKNWTLNPNVVPTIVNSGSSYSAGDMPYGQNPDKNPCFPFQLQITSVDGNGGAQSLAYAIPGGIAGLPNASQGAYSLSPADQATLWTGNNFNVFYNNIPNLFAMTGGTGTGLVVDTTNAWAGDYDATGFFNPGQTLQADTMLGDIEIVGGPGASTNSSLTSFSSTYGLQFGVMITGLNYRLNSFTCNGFGVGGYFRSVSDFVGRDFNPVKCRQGINVFGGGSITLTEMRMDSCGTVAVIDQCNNSRFSGRAFYANSNKTNGPTAGQGQTGALLIGQNSSTKYVAGTDIDFQLQNVGGNSAPIAAAAVAYMLGGSLHLDVTNFDETRGQCSYLLNQMLIFGSGVDSSCRFTGRFDGGPNNLFGTTAIVSGTIPQSQIDIWDATVNLTAGTCIGTVGGTLTAGDVVSVTLTQAVPLPGYPVIVSYTTVAGDTNTSIAAGIAAVLNASGTLTANKTTAASSGFNFTVTGPMNGTAITASVSGSHTETITFNPSAGLIGGGTRGGRLITGNIYELRGSGAPTAFTGYGKANAGSTYFNLSNGTLYRNTGTASAPAWTTP